MANTCQLSDFDQFDRDILAFFPSRWKEGTMLTLCHAFCDHVHHHGFPAEAEEAKYHLALIRLYIKRRPKMAVAMLRCYLDNAIQDVLQMVKLPSP